MRTGKSFLLDQMVRSATGRPGFSWRGGMARHTGGLHIYPEPLVVERGGEKLAVYLMDTQGTFDHRTTVRENMTVFALSTMTSSVLVYNVQHGIRWPLPHREPLQGGPPPAPPALHRVRAPRAQTLRRRTLPETAVPGNLKSPLLPSLYPSSFPHIGAITSLAVNLAVFLAVPQKIAVFFAVFLATPKKIAIFLAPPLKILQQKNAKITAIFSGGAKITAIFSGGAKITVMFCGVAKNTAKNSSKNYRYF